MAYVEYEADGKTIKARVWQKVDTLANWEANSLVIGPGEQAFVIDGGGTPINFKIGDGTKKFSELPWWISYDQGQYVQVVGNALPTPTVELGYSFVGPGTYTHAGGDVVAPDGRFSQIVFEGGSWSLKDMGALPDNTPKEWSAQTYTAGKQVYKYGQIWEASTEALATDVPGASSKWLAKTYGKADFVNNSFNPATGGITQFSTKQLAREATDQSIRKRGLVITYKLESVSQWIIEQYVGSTSPDWSYADDAFIDLSKTNTSGEYHAVSTYASYDQTNQTLTIPSGVISTDDGRRINSVGGSLVVPTGYSRLVASRGGVLSLQSIDIKIDTFLSNEQINLGTFYLAGLNSKLVNIGDNFPLFGQSIKDADERMVLVNNSASSINFDLNNRLIKITGGAFIDSQGVTNGRVNLPSAEIPMPSAITAGVVLYNRANNTIVVRNQTDRPLKNHYILFVYQYSGSLASFTVEGLTNYFVNGSKVSPTIEKVAVLNNKESDINFDLNSRTIYINGGAVIDDSGASGRINLPVSTVSMPSSMPNAVVLYDKINNTVVVRNQASPPASGNLILFTYQYNGIFADFVVNGLSRYQVNGISNNTIDIRGTNLFSVDNFAVDFWDAPVQPSATTGDTINLYTLKSTQLYPMYDAIQALYPSNITKQVVGTTDSGFEVLRYDISFNRKTATLERRRKPRIFITGGIHGGEAVGVYTTYLLFKHIVQNPNNDDILNILRTNYDFTFMPLCNPYALDVGSVGGTSSVRWNHNGVDINRNFDYRWSDYADGGLGSQTYKGTAPFSEKESQFVRDVFNSIKADTVLHLDCHNYGGSSLPDKRSVWFAASNDTMQNMLDALCDRLDFEAKKKWSYLPTDKWTAFSTLDFVSPMSQSWVQNQQVMSCTLETDQTDSFNASDMTNFNSNVMTRSLETYVNTVYSLGKSSVNLLNRLKR